MVGRGSNIRWDYLVNQYDSTGSGRHIGAGLGGLGGLGGIGGRDNINRHTQFVMEFASVVSVLQVRLRFLVRLKVLMILYFFFPCFDHSIGQDQFCH